METLSTPLVVAAALFLAVLVWRVRPAIGLGRRSGASREAIRAHLARAEAAKGNHERALALCDAADLLSTRAARGLYLRAMRADPASAEVVARAVSGLSRRPRALEAVLWRHLSTSPWTETREASGAALDAMRALYEGPLRNGVRARVFAHARDTLRAS
jgi:hypothetical protein